MSAHALSELILPMILMSIPVLLIIAGLTAAIIRSNSRHRLLELAQRERIAAIERGMDPDKLPQIQLPDSGDPKPTFLQKQERRSQLLLIWGMVVLGFGIPMYLGIGYSEGFGEAAPALMFAGVGIALILGSRLTRPSSEDLRRERDRGPAGQATT